MDSALDEQRSLYHSFHVVNPPLGKQLMIIGGTLLAVGAILCWWRPFRGGLPGDIVIEQCGIHAAVGPEESNCRVEHGNGEVLALSNAAFAGKQCRGDALHRGV